MARRAQQNPAVAFLHRQWRAHPRLFVSIAFGLVVWLAVPAQSGTTGFLVAWNAGTWLFIALAIKMVWSATPADVRRHAGVEEEGRGAMLALITAAVIVTLVALVFELSNAKNLQGTARGLHVALALASIAGSWLFMNIAFATHYAHEYHSLQGERKGERKGEQHDKSAKVLEFPGGAEPDYSDFLYFAMVLGTTFQTSDVDIYSRPMRRIAMIQGLIAFFYNTAVIALTVNIASQFFGG